MAAPGKLRSLANLSNEQEFVTNLQDLSLSFEGSFRETPGLLCLPISISTLRRSLHIQR
ncbi:hypothetical protein GIV52_23955 [Pseudomonas syringae]|uniref:Uncharacterized protein n=1 Tax=Pseudomonas syringae TaxID=317 RepID=A0A9Q4FF84_PSESX|nr:hypothetical protein [Pseudomonas syringae]MCF5473391.1 hypothetical protein [Pseudomonas syringae]MCF5483406.1 hypothetical protein [Pseudomonas syringae]MCF5487358.1 hypothetical protein [Pseudomonas syringae]MCF5492464.1 hypothetical protein [Pseudomonas syringae]